MKLKSTIAMLGLTASISAFAQFTPNPTGQSAIGPAAPGEQSLQQIADNLFGPGQVNVATGQSSDYFWSSATPGSSSTIPTLVAEFTANSSTQTFGIWFGTNPSNVVTYDILLGGASANTAAGLQIVGNQLSIFGPSGSCGTSINCNTFSNSLINSNAFGFYFRPTANSPTYYSLDALNGGPRQDRFVPIQQGSSTNWLFAYEDGTDFDYNDMAVKVESIKAAVPEPETYALMIAGLGAMGFVARRRKAS